MINYFRLWSVLIFLTCLLSCQRIQGVTLTGHAIPEPNTYSMLPHNKGLNSSSLLIDEDSIFVCHETHYLKYPESKIAYRHILRFWDDGQVLWNTKICDPKEHIDISSLSFDNATDISGSLGYYSIANENVYIEMLEKVPNSGHTLALYRGVVSSQKEFKLIEKRTRGALIWRKFRVSQFGDSYSLDFIKYDVQGMRGEPSW